jgi:hypothetical protein
MNQRFFPTVGHRLATFSPGMRRHGSMGAPLAWLGLGRRRSRAPSSVIVAATTAVLGAVAALLFAPETGRDMRSRLGRLGKHTGGALGEQIGRLFGRQAGSHPLKTAKIANTVRETFGSQER